MKLQHLFLIGICISLVALFAAVDSSQAQVGGTAPPVTKPANGWLEPSIDLNMKGRSTEFRQVARSDSLDDDKKQFISDFLRKCTVPEFADGSKRDMLPSLRSSLSIILRTSSGSVHDYITHTLVDELTFMSIDPRINPVARYNAAIMLGELNQKEIDGSTPPTPLPEATIAMMKLLDWKSTTIPAPQLDSPVKLPAVWNNTRVAVSDEVITAALLGLERHAALGIADANVRQKILAELSQFIDVTKTTKPAGRSAEGHVWMLEIACRIIGLMHESGPGGIPLKQLATLVFMDTVPFSVRCEAAQAIGTLKIDANNPFKPANVLLAVEKMVGDVCNAELKADMIEPRRLRYRLQSALSAVIGRNAAGFVKDETGGKGVAPVLPGDRAKKTTDIIKYVIAPTDKYPIDDVELEEAIQTAIDQLKKL